MPTTPMRAGHSGYGSPAEAELTLEESQKVLSTDDVTNASSTALEPSAAAKDREIAAVIAIFAMDIGWVNLMPSVGLPAILGAVALQGSVVADSAGCGSFELVHNAVVFLWVLANAIWMMSEYIWDEDRPEGFLANMPGLSHLDRSMFPDILTISSVIMWATCFGLMLFYASALNNANASRSRQMSVGQKYPSAVPLPIYRDLFILPWLLSDSCWILCNRCMALGRDAGGLVTLGTVFGVISLVLLGDATRRYWLLAKHGEVGHCTAEFLWVAGNVGWFVVDMRMEETAEIRYAFCGMFTLGLFLVIVLSMYERRSKPKRPVYKTPVTLGAYPGERRYLLEGPGSSKAEPGLLL
eukprot:TRINITY_DN124639_c0_g1_i1.p1 TRINITY_DN124639_c0_g1~~TRINITY_DN124639_c0_g1_i1.p1  ORF type:complete len:354 (+),score=71.88 TRINITY_DN124639_c0_g1_i1:115-1176(+)